MDEKHPTENPTENWMGGRTPDQDVSGPPDGGAGSFERSGSLENSDDSDSSGRGWPPWTLLDLGLFVLFAIAGFLLSSIIILAGIQLLNLVPGLEITLADPQVQTPLAVTLQILWEGLWILFIYFLITRKYGKPFWAAIRWVDIGPKQTTFMWYGFAMAILIQVAFHFFPTDTEMPIEQMFTTPAAGYLLAFFGVCVAPFVEELVFRGFFYPVFETRWGLIPAVGLTGGLFALIHAQQLGGGIQELLAMTTVGIILSYVRGKTGSLIPSFLMHFSYNATLFAALYFSTDYFRALSG